MSEPAETPPAAAAAPLNERTRLLHIVVLWSFAIVQPTLSTLSDSVGFFFPLRRVEGWAFVLMLILLTVVPPAFLWAVGALAGRGRPRARQVAHLVAIGLLAAGLAAYALREAARVGLGLSAIVALAAGVGFAAAYARFGPLRYTLSVLGPAPVVFLASFLFFTNASHLVFPRDSQAVGAATSRPTPVVLLILDELPAASLMTDDGDVDAGLFPNLARFAGEATWYSTAMTASWTTTTAVPAILTGQEPDPDDLPVVSDHPENIFLLLRRTHAERVIESFTRLCPLTICPNEGSGARRLVALASAMSLLYVNVVLPRGSSLRAPTPGNTWGAVLAALDPKRVIDPFKWETGDLRLFPGPQFDRFLSSIGPPTTGGKPPLYFLHANLPHNPYNHMPSGKLYRDHSKDEPGLDTSTEKWGADTDGVLHGWQRHLLQVQFADKLVGQLMDRLRSAGIYDDALVVIVSDHGASFFPERNRRKPEGLNTSDIALVPLIVKSPGQREGKVVDEPVSTLDILPTIAEETGARLPWKVDGRPLSQAAAGAGRRFRLLDADDNWLTLHPPTLRTARVKTIRLRDSFFEPDPPGLFGIGPGRDLIGKPVASAAKGRPVGLRAALVDAEEYERVDPRSTFVPTLVRGTLAGDRGPVAAVAAVVNGVVAGAGGLRRHPDGYAFSLMIPEAALRPGRNDVEIVGVTGDKPPYRVHELNG